VKWLIDSLIPDSISRQVLGYLTQLRKARKLGLAGAAALMFTALSLVLTIDRTLNGIWRVQRLRPLAQRVLVYWAALTLGPLLVGASLATTSYVWSVSSGWVPNAMSGALSLMLGGLEYALLATSLAALYYYVPYTRVARAHAWVGGIVAALLIELGKKLLTAYIALVPTYSAVYGAFATVPILLLWIYVAWLMVLLGAVVAAYLPTLLSGRLRQGGTPGWTFQLAVEALQQLHGARHAPEHGLSLQGLGLALRVDPLQLVGVMEVLMALDWVGLRRPAGDEPALCAAGRSQRHRSTVGRTPAAGAGQSTGGLSQNAVVCAAAFCAAGPPPPAA
jgi:membrane protein